MDQNTLPQTAATAPQLPVAQAVASLGAQPVVAAPPVVAPPVAPAPAPTLPVAPFAVILTDTANVEHPVHVTSAKLSLERHGALTSGSVVLRSRVHGNPAIASLLTLANLSTLHRVTIRYFSPNGSVLRDDQITINPTSRAIYQGPELSETGDGWEFYETLTIHA